jgi:hypothetical protein
MKMRKNRWPTPSYLFRLLLIYLTVALAAACAFMTFAISITRPETLFGIAFGMMLGFFLYYAVSRRGGDLVTRITDLFFHEHI